MIAVPDRTEAAAFFFTYIDQVPAGDVRDVLEAQLPATVELFSAISEARSQDRYEPGKWSVRQLLSHVNDTERAFVFRALWFARGFDTPLHSFDQTIAIASADADARALARHVEEFRAIRSATVAFFRDLPDFAWARRGTAGGNPFTVRALAFITAGHLAHHSRILRERYLDHDGH
jgi:hypothetical protein